MADTDPSGLPVYVRVGEDGAEHLIGTVSLEDPQVIAQAVAELLRAAGLAVVEIHPAALVSEADDD